MASKQRNRTRRPARSSQLKEPKRRFLVVCEGAVTEPEYIRGFTQLRRSSVVEVQISPEHGVPKTLVKIAKDTKDKARAAAKRERDENLNFDEVWCVFDIDDHPGVSDACEMARANNIRVAISNPCFELWLWLHFHDSPGSQTRHELQRRVKSLGVLKGKHLDFDKFSVVYSEAVKRADRLLKQVDGDYTENPSTSVHLLTQAIEAGGSSGLKT